MEKLIFSLIFSLSVCSASNVPALIWSTDRSLSDLPDVFAGHVVSSADFQNRYLKPLSSGQTESSSKGRVSALVVFVQDRLSLDDFTHYADVYNEASNGGAFQTVKDFMDEQFSVQLSHVESPLAALETVRRSYQGKIHELEAPYDINQLSLTADKGNLIVVHLPKISPATPEKSIAKSDKLIGKVLSQLTKKEVKYTAIYTAESSSKEREESLTYKGRHLLQEAPSAPAVDPAYNRSLFINSTCGLFYALTLQMVAKTDTGEVIVGNLTTMKSFDLPCVNTSEPQLWTLMFDKPENTSITSDVKLELNFTTKPMTQGFDWHIGNTILTYTGTFGNETETGEHTLELNSEEIWAPHKMSYHCGQPDPIRLINSSLSNVTLVFRKIQIQPYSVEYTKFGLPWDCVFFFTPAIWMALFSILILLLILAYGLYMMMSITVMDRFDDVKGKTIVINTAD